MAPGSRARRRAPSSFVESSESDELAAPAERATAPSDADTPGPVPAPAPVLKYRGRPAVNHEALYGFVHPGTATGTSQQVGPGPSRAPSKSSVPQSLLWEVSCGVLPRLSTV